jgi:hypothetical protein
MWEQPQVGFSMRSRVLSALPFSWPGWIEENDASGQGHEPPYIITFWPFGPLPRQGGRENGVGRVGLRVVPSHVSDRTFRNTI